MQLCVGPGLKGGLWVHLLVGLEIHMDLRNVWKSPTVKWWRSHTTNLSGHMSVTGHKKDNSSKCNCGVFHRHWQVEKGPPVIWWHSHTSNLTDHMSVIGQKDREYGDVVTPTRSIYAPWWPREVGKKSFRSPITCQWLDKRNEWSHLTCNLVVLYHRPGYVQLPKWIRHDKSIKRLWK